jgi:hypothetical protein
MYLRDKKKPYLLATGLLLVLTNCTAGVWILSTPSVTAFLVSDARDIQVSRTGLGEWQIAYTTTGKPYAWYHGLARMLKVQHWILRNPPRPDLAGPGYDPIVPLRFEMGYGWLLWDEAVLKPDHHDPYRASIQLHRRIVLP